MSRSISLFRDFDRLRTFSVCSLSDSRGRISLTFFITINPVGTIISKWHFYHTKVADNSFDPVILFEWFMIRLQMRGIQETKKFDPGSHQ